MPSPTLLLLALLICLLALQCSSFVPPSPPSRSFARPPPLFASPSPPPPPLTPSKIALLLERSFVAACKSLASGYVDELKLFIVSSKAGYERGLTIPQLKMELKECPSESAGRPLAQEEVDLRAVWMSLVYLTLENVRHPASGGVGEAGAAVEAEIRKQYTTFVYDVVNAHKQGFTLQTLKLEELARSDPEDKPRTQLETAILSQCMRLVMLTLTVLEEEKLAGDETLPPKPPIKGT